ncbi:MAG: molybdenum cofactor biosynthesis protein MoaE [Candidatus Acididesulfobacter guangdongensis]|uniref:Molybdenum cofactor biosynthesis protein MoaE n=1 Tax=Acididesulfobacter guangdongensis TaxID=2597225 RepID=A0A519BG66_ACIG2|nr:MAG: molybdenum cofactor biosynthesis protein MoaE [Candidatus Acididesulfobacter guangdongensis]
MATCNSFYYIDIVKIPIDVNIALNFVNDAASGSTLLFNGTVRDNEDGTPVKFLYYEAYEEMAFKEIDKLISAAFEKYDLNKIAVIHRTGKIEIGGISISIAVSSPHRDSSYIASKFLIDNIKETVPIWKKESFGEYEKWKRI